MQQGIPTKVAGACMGLSGFAIAVFAGLGGGHPSEDILSRALLSMLGCYVVGLAIGAVMERAVEERLAAHRSGALPIAATPETARPAEDDVIEV